MWVIGEASRTASRFASEQGVGLDALGIRPQMQVSTIVLRAPSRCSVAAKLPAGSVTGQRFGPGIPRRLA
jgi:hypothetical protein